MSHPSVSSFASAMLIGAGGLTLSIAPAMAHHVGDEDVPQTALDGLLSGLAHPIIGLDHIAFLIAFGTITALTVPTALHRIPLITCFILATVAGSLAITATRAEFTFLELVVATTTAGVGALLFWRPNIDSAELLFGGMIAGIIHGAAFGGAIIGAQPGPIMSYLTGIVIWQLLALIALMWGIDRFAATLTQRFYKMVGGGTMTVGIALAAFGSVQIAISS